MSVELYFLINLLADLSLLSAAAGVLGCLRLKRVAPAAALAAAFGTLARALPGLSGPPVQCILLIPLSMLVTRQSDPRTVAAFALSLGFAAMVTGTCAAYSRHTALAVIAIPRVYALANRLRRRCLTETPARIEIVNRGRKSVLRACIDTGNRLTEPLSGQPVLVASAHLLHDVLPDGGYRQVAYGSVGGAGTLRCFRPDDIFIDARGRRRRAPESWVAVFPERLPGPAQALAPAEYLLY